jgi:hypothetical protein
LNELWKNNCKQHLKTKNIKQNNVLGFEANVVVAFVEIIPMYLLFLPFIQKL